MEQSNIAGILLGLLGLVLCVFPGEIWKITEKWKSEGAEKPSRRYGTVLRALGGVFVACGLLLAFGIIR